jgi:phospholipase C
VDHSEASGDQGWDGGKWDEWIEAKSPATMAYYTRADLPFLYALADAYTVCDEYHCSVLGPTYPNRLYLMTGTIDPNGLAGGPVTDNGLWNTYSWTTYPERLQAAGVTWKVYQQASDYFNLNPLRWFAQYTNTMPGNPLYDRGLVLVNNLVTAFQSDVTNGTLPQVSWIIPPWSLSEHPPFAPASGQMLTKQLLDALASNPAMYNSTVFILTYDEDGGFFDHVPAPVPPAGITNEFVNGLPIGLGVRVPTILVSPWTRGGYVCSQVFDHTSVIRFLEQWTGVQEPNISGWRRQVSGDLTSAFDFTSPDTSYPLLPAPTLVNCASNVTSEPPSPQTFPVQEAGTNFSRACPYHCNAFSFTDCANHRLGITMTNAGTASAHFATYANAFRTDGPWQYDVPASGSVTGWFSIAASGGCYDFTCYGPHRFHQRFAGSINADCNPLDVEASLNPDGSSFTLAMQNATAAPVTFTLTSAAQPGASISYTVLPGYLVTNTFPGAVDSNGLYSFAATASTDPTFLRQFSGDDDTAELQFMTNDLPVVSNTAPVVTLIGANPLTNECHAAFTDPGATASDDDGGSLGVTADSTVNANAVGTYTIQYSATDQSGRSATNTRTVYIVDTTAPVVTLIGANPMTHAVNTFFTDPGATASDACAGSLSVATNITVNANAVGTYTIQYSATDPSGNSATNTRTVYIVVPPPLVVSVPAISLSGGNIILTYPLWASDYTLESAPDLASGSWAAVNAASVTNAGNVVVTLPVTANPLYFRMRP